MMWLWLMLAWSFSPTLLVTCAGVLINQQPHTRGPAVPHSLRQSQEGTGSHSIPLTPIPRPALTLTAKRAQLLLTIFVLFLVQVLVFIRSCQLISICKVALRVLNVKVKRFIFPHLQLPWASLYFEYRWVGLLEPECLAGLIMRLFQAAV